MSGKGNCWDNAVAESFFKTFKSELVYGSKLKTKEQMSLNFLSQLSLQVLMIDIYIILIIRV